MAMLAWPARVPQGVDVGVVEGPAVDAVVEREDPDDVAHAAQRHREDVARAGLGRRRLELGRPGAEPAAHAVAGDTTRPEHPVAGVMPAGAGSPASCRPCSATSCSWSGAP